MGCFHLLTVARKLKGKAKEFFISYISFVCTIPKCLPDVYCLLSSSFFIHIIRSYMIDFFLHNDFSIRFKIQRVIVLNI